MASFYKTTYGYVTQKFNDQGECLIQTFTPSCDYLDVSYDYEDENGLTEIDMKDMPFGGNVCFPFEMVQKNKGRKPCFNSVWNSSPKQSIYYPNVNKWAKQKNYYQKHNHKRYQNIIHVFCLFLFFVKHSITDNSKNNKNNTDSELLSIMNLYKIKLNTNRVRQR